MLLSRLKFSSYINVLLKRSKRKGRGGSHKEFRSNNLVYTKRQKDIYVNRKHETTKFRGDLNSGLSSARNIWKQKSGSEGGNSERTSSKFLG